MGINRKQEASFHGGNESKRLADCLLKWYIMRLVYRYKDSKRDLY